MLTLIVFLIILGLLIFVHEFGHFIVAKKKGLLVEEFGFGFPPRIFSWKKRETVYSINLIPFGGFVKIFGEEGEGKNNSRSFSSQKISTKMMIVSAGVLMNILFTVVILVFGNFWGLPKIIDKNISSFASVRNVEMRILYIAPNSPAQSADLKTGDIILSAGFGERDLKFNKVENFQKFIQENKGKFINLKIKRQLKILKKKVFAREKHPINEGPLGIAIAKTGIVSYPFYLAPLYGIKDSFILFFNFLEALGYFFKNLIVNGHLIGEVGGPVQIAFLIDEMTKMGFSFVLQFTALLSLNLAILNILPFPALDGGRFVFLVIEGIRKKPLNPSVEKVVHFIGFIILIILMILVTIKDIKKFF